ncbi:hypothetical protein ACFVFS_02700 [Kitasatospora sp. NPDC057692]|uniref:hypothetical protein n=1 Tax=Kitasatospora sp. NPDC057692 TaxID=3346215 RepID=UPI00369C994D
MSCAATVFAAFFVLSWLIAPDPPPSVVGRWVVSEGPAGTRLELLDGERLGPSVIPASACGATALEADDLREIADGTRDAYWDPDGGYGVSVSVAQPATCSLAFGNYVAKGGEHTLWFAGPKAHWALVRP